VIGHGSVAGHLPCGWLPAQGTVCTLTGDAQLDGMCELNQNTWNLNGYTLTGGVYPGTVNLGTSTVDVVSVFMGTNNCEDNTLYLESTNTPKLGSDLDIGIH
jgi:hypothetical protein